ncbi:acetate/propionate family kinase [Frigoriglobus tundricola]|uniref:Acetate kinase n=1 Tax=Frigoriglobus tundricola TaxID=2774151 RepID=A0A6M5YKZ2_9BACT|nr:acetate/propionate family kinase [Frigoriglobus tundricola]QJW94648.1 Acetate kinase [Frigoriglobus tundricola]
MNPASPHILTINGGSSSLKFALFVQAEPDSRRVSGRVDRIGSANARWLVDRGTAGAEDRAVDAPDQTAAVQLLIEWLERTVGFASITAIGHRIVHGGSRYSRPERVTPEMIQDLRALDSFDPDHLPGEIELVEALRTRGPDVPQVACFDTAFHHDMPRVARIVPIPRRYEAVGVRRYGFHGLSYAYLMAELARVAGPEAAAGRVVLAHLGNGASLAGVSGGRSVDTTMGFTPASGLVMGTRTGDIDPGLVRFLARTEGTTADQFDALANHASGLLGVSETSSDVRDLLAREGADVRAAEALELFCYQSKKWIGAMAAALGGVDTLVFAGGIGENAPEIRRRICAGLGFLGIGLNDARNAAGAGLISTDRGPVQVRVIRTDEELMIAKSVARLLGPDAGA